MRQPLCALVVAAFFFSLGWSQGIDYSWPMFGGNLQRTNNAPHAAALTNPNMTWYFLDPNGQPFMDLLPIYDHIMEVVWTVSSDGFVYQVNATDGAMLYEVCVGKPPAFPGDPCGGVGFDLHQHGQLTLLSTSRDVFMTYMTPQEGPDVMVRISAKDGSVVWKVMLYNDTVDASGNSDFLSLPAVLPKAINNATDAIVLWILSYNCSDNPENALCTTYTVINADTGAVVTEKVYLSFNYEGYTFAPPTVDPQDGNIYTSYTNDEIDACNAAYKCEGLGKYSALTGELLWNTSTQESWPTGIAVYNGMLQVSTSQLDAYAYNSKSGAPVWKILESTSTADMYYPSICSDGTILFTDNAFYVQGWSPTISRVKKPQFWSGCTYCSKMATTTNDGNFYVNSDNQISSRSCKDGSINWERYFGDYTTTGSVAIGFEAIYVNVYKPGDGGALIKLQDLSNTDVAW